MQKMIERSENQDINRERKNLSHWAYVIRGRHSRGLLGAGRWQIGSHGIEGNEIKELLFRAGTGQSLPC
jgi:hypothetical protein